MSSRGQIVIPLNIREMMGLKDGEKFIVSGQKDTIILKRFPIPGFDALMKESHEFARKNKLTKKDLDEALRRAGRI